MKIITSSVVGASYATVKVLFDISTIVNVLISLFFAVVMISIAFTAKGIKRKCITVAMFLFISTTLGGIMSVVYAFFNSVLAGFIVENSYEGMYSDARNIIIIGLTAVVAVVLVRILVAKKDVRIANIIVKLNDKEYRINGFCDSGNLLVEPFSGRRVILVSESSALGKRIQSVDDIYKKYIPYKDVTGSGILKGIVPKEIIINDKSVDAVIASVNESRFNGYDALVPSALL